MKVKKFLTLLILSSFLVGCNLNPGNNDASSNQDGGSSENKPTTWDADVKALLAENAYGYDLPYFNASDYGFGTLKWSVSPTGIIYAEGSNVPATGTGEESPLKPIADLYKADGFVASQEPSAKDSVYFYTLEKTLTVEGNERYLKLRIATSDSEGYFRNGGDFYFEVGDPYYYSWADTGFEDAIKSNEDFANVNFVGFGDSFRYLKNDASSAAKTAKNGYVDFKVIGISAEQSEAYFDGLENQQWLVFDSPRDDYDVDAVDPSKVLRIGASYDSEASELTVRVDNAPTIPENVALVAELLSVPGLGYAFSSSDTHYSYDFDEELGDGQELGDLIDKYSALLKAGADNDFAIRGSRRTSPDGTVYEKYLSESLVTLVSIYAGEDEDEKGKYVVEVVVQDYVEVPDLYKPAIALFGLDEVDFNVVPDTEKEAGYVYNQIPIAEGTTEEAAIQTYLDMIEADDTLGYKVETALKEVKMNSGAKGLYAAYINSDTMIEVYAYSGTIQIVISAYAGPRESAWADEAISKIASIDENYDLSWDTDSQSYVYQDLRALGEGETLQSVVDDIFNALYDDETLNLTILTDEKFTKAADGYDGAHIIVCSSEAANEGSIEINYTDGYWVAAKPVLEISIILYDKTLPFTVNAIGSAMGLGVQAVNDEDTGELSYYTTSYGALKFSGTTSLTQYGQSIIRLYIGSKLSGAEALGFTLQGFGWVGNSLAGVYANDDGYEAYVILDGDNNKNYTGYYKVVIYPPVADAGSGN